MRKTAIILSILSLLSCNRVKQSNVNEQFKIDSIEQVQREMEMDSFSNEVFVDEANDVFIISEKYKNKEGISVNSTIEEFAEKYSDFRILYIREKKLFIAESFQAPLKYVLDGNNFIGTLKPSQEITILKQSDFRPNTKITKLWMHSGDKKESQDVTMLINMGIGISLDKATNTVFIVMERFKTNKGIGINSTIEEFIKKYPDFRILYIREKNLFIIETFYSGLKFVLSENDFIGQLNLSEEITVLKPSDFKPNSKIIKIWMK